MPAFTPSLSSSDGGFLIFSAHLAAVGPSSNTRSAIGERDAQRAVRRVDLGDRLTRNGEPELPRKIRWSVSSSALPSERCRPKWTVHCDSAPIVGNREAGIGNRESGIGADDPRAHRELIAEHSRRAIGRALDARNGRLATDAGDGRRERRTGVTSTAGGRRRDGSRVCNGAASLVPLPASRFPLPASRFPLPGLNQSRRSATIGSTPSRAARREPARHGRHQRQKHRDAGEAHRDPSASPRTADCARRA